MNNVLIIDDDKELCALMKKCVEQENLSALVAHGGVDGLHLANENKRNCSLVILDVMMPDIDGFQVLRKIRETSNVPVLMLTAKSDEEDKVSGLRLGADDYLTKPFSLNELMARVNSLIRRYTTLNPVAQNDASTILLKDMVIDKVNRTVILRNLPVELTGKEFDFSKVAVVILMSLGLCLFIFAMSAIGGVIAGGFPDLNMDTLFHALILHLIGGLLIPVAMLPIVFLATLSKGYVLPIGWKR